MAAVFVPVAAGASILSSILGNDVYAGGAATVPSTNNSQTIALLSADIVSVPKNGKKEDPTETTGNIAGTIVADNALMPGVTPASGNGIGGSDADMDYSGADDMSVYVVRKGDSIAQIAQMFDVSVNTILWANDLKKGEPLKQGDTLFILPVSGVQHTVAKGETLAGISKKYKVDVDIIEGFNGLERGAALAVGDELIVPDAVMPNDAPKSNIGKSGGSSSGASAKWVDAKGYFKHPVPGMRRRSQGPHGLGGRGVDMAAPTGTPIVAAADGIVILSKDGYNGGYGNMEVVQHANGTKTLYAHMSKRAASTGQKVTQGEVIGYVGSTGRSTGPHLHFEVQGAKNPF